MRFWFTSTFVFLALFLAVEAASGQQPSSVSVSAQPAGSTPILQYFSNSRPYSWDQVFYGPPPRPRKLSKIEKHARHTSAVLARGLGYAVFEDESFGEVLEGFFLGQHELEIKVDWDALAASSGHVTRDSNVNLEVGHTTVEEVLGEVLDHLSEQAQAEEDLLTFYVFEGKVKVSTRGVFGKLIVTRIYNISFIARGTPHYIDAPELGINRRIPLDLAESRVTRPLPASSRAQCRRPSNRRGRSPFCNTSATRGRIRGTKCSTAHCRDRASSARSKNRPATPAKCWRAVSVLRCLRMSRSAMCSKGSFWASMSWKSKWIGLRWRRAAVT